MQATRFVQLVERLTGTPCKDLGPEDITELARALRDDGRKLDHSQFNELLLLVNKDRVAAPFYERYFSGGTISTLEEAVEHFQRDALLRYGNFVHAYRKLSRLSTSDALKSELGDLCTATAAIVDEFKARSPKLLEVQPITRDKTYLVGYLSGREAARDRLIADGLHAVCSKASDWEAVGAAIDKSFGPDIVPSARAIASHYQNTGATVEKTLGILTNEVVPGLDALIQEVAAVQKQATKNQDVYLTWDHMDIYFATSMRRRWEFEDLFDFVDGLMGTKELAELNLRYFDPTQSFTKNRIDKGLVEALMLRRAKCTVYSVQDTDTLGKDSELASTLAQGKSVIAFVPRIDVESRSRTLANGEPTVLLERLRFLQASDAMLVRVISEDATFFDQLEEFEATRPWISLPHDASAFKAKHADALARYSKLIADSERRHYDSRANTLRQSHPLGVQVHLETGVANGVLVVRSIPDCARVLRGVLTNDLRFKLIDDPSAGMCYLEEEISESTFRVVTHNRKLTNCFWNFYNRS